MEGSGRPSFQYGGGDRKLDIVSGRVQYYSNNSNIVDENEIPPAMNRRTEVAPPPAAAVSSSSKGWGLSDPEVKRRKRIAKYKAYSVEGRVKASIRNGIRWMKNKCSEIIHGY